MKNLKLLIPTAVVLLALCAVSARAQYAYFSTTRTYVAGYQVVGNVAIPVMGVVRDEAYMSPGCVRISYGQVVPRMAVVDVPRFDSVAVQQQKLALFYAQTAGRSQP